MNKEIQTTNFIVDEQLCTGCGTCVDACPMHILEINDDICAMTRDYMCLECGSCMRKCPEHAIVIEGISEKAQSQMKEMKIDEGLGDKQVFTPILKKLTALIFKELNPTQVYEYQGMDIRELDEYELEGKTCYSRLYRSDKVEKISVSSTNFFWTDVCRCDGHYPNTGI